jgi:hypothetical protein
MGVASYQMRCFEMWNTLKLNGLDGETDGYISLNAISGSQGTRAIHLRALIGNQVLSVLVDSGSSNTFINSAMTVTISYTSQPASALRVKVAIGQVILSTAEIKGIEWWIQVHTFCTDARVLDIGAYDMILGMDWLEMHSPMQCDWARKTIGFMYKGYHISLQGVKCQPVE